MTGQQQDCHQDRLPAGRRLRVRDHNAGADPAVRPVRRHQPHLQGNNQQDPEAAAPAAALRVQGIIKLRINSNINCFLISVFFYSFKNKTIEDKSESEAL